MNKSKENRKQVDWELIEPEWRAGIKSKLQLSKEFGVSRTAIDKHFGKLGIDRDLTAKIHAEAEAKVARLQVAPEVATKRRVTEQRVIATNSDAIVDVVVNQRQDVRGARSIVQKLWNMVESELDSPVEFKELGELLANPDDNGNDKLNDMYHAAIGLPQQIKNAKLLADALKVLIELERKVLRIKDDPEPTATVVLKADPNLSPAEAYLRMLGKK